MIQSSDHHWLLFMAQLPAEPSSPRVAMWRRLKAAGATSLLNGTWVLPMNESHAATLAQLESMVRDKGGSAALFVGRDIDGVTSGELVKRFRADRAREYNEFASRANGLLEKIAKVAAVRKFGFAELEEIKDDLEKLTVWLGKIEARDFFSDGRHDQATALLAACCEAKGHLSNST